MLWVSCFFFLSGFMIVMNNYSWKEQAWFTFFFLNIDYLGRIVENAFFFLCRWFSDLSICQLKAVVLNNKKADKFIS